MNALALAMLAQLEPAAAAGPPSVADEAALALRLFQTPARHPRPERESRLLQSAVRSTVAGGVSVQSWGDSAAPATILAHGWEGRGAQLGAFVDPLVAAGRRVVAFDAPAHGDSPGTQANLPEFSRALTAVASQMGRVDSVIAHSFGVPATAFAMERMGFKPQRLVLIAGPDSLNEALVRFRDFLGLSGDAFTIFRAEIRKIGGLSGDDFRTGDALRHAGLPTLVIHAPDDAEVPFAEAEAIVASDPAARLLRADGCGHRKVLFAPEIVAAVTDFLTRPA